MDYKEAEQEIVAGLDTLKKVRESLKSISRKVKDKTASTDIINNISKISNAEIDLENVLYDIQQGNLEFMMAPAHDVEEWKDIVSQTLPEGASLAMANDVDDALDKFKSVY